MGWAGEWVEWVEWVGLGFSFCLDLVLLSLIIPGQGEVEGVVLDLRDSRSRLSQDCVVRDWTGLWVSAHHRLCALDSSASAGKKSKTFTRHCGSSGPPFS